MTSNNRIMNTKRKFYRIVRNIIRLERCNNRCIGSCIYGYFKDRDDKICDSCFDRPYNAKFCTSCKAIMKSFIKEMREKHNIDVIYGKRNEE